MNKWSKKSLRVRATLDPRLQLLVNELLLYMDLSLISGHRTEKQQNELYPKYTQVQYPNSMHNKYPSLAVDVRPYPYPEKEGEQLMALSYMAGMAVMLAEQLGFKIRWGGDWDRDGDILDNAFDDLFHLEIYDEEGDTSVGSRSS